MRNREKTERQQNQPMNILFILCDQERFIDRSSDEYKAFDQALRARKRLQESGVSFTNHQINSAVCTSSRSVIYTGQHITFTGMFDNLDFPWAKSLSKELPTLGDMAAHVGYYPVYKGKWHLSEELEDSSYQDYPTKELTEVMEQYGFNDYMGIGDIIGTTRGGYYNDEKIGADAITWLRSKGKELNEHGRPWLTAVNLVNPHDVMYYNTDDDQISPTDDDSQINPMPLFNIAREPRTASYTTQWEIDLPKSLAECPSGDIPAHVDTDKANSAGVGTYPKNSERCTRLQDYYFNCIRDTDQVVEKILDELDDLGLRDNTIIVMTSDHGELGGAHGLSGKGATAFKEQNHVPLIISHPGYTQTHNTTCNAVTSHLDLVPTMINWAAAFTGKSHDDVTRELRTKALPGKDLTIQLEGGAEAGQYKEVWKERGVLYCYNMFSTLDGGLWEEAMAYFNEHGGSFEGFEGAIDFTKRGAIRSIFDGQYKYTRYFSNLNHHKPETLAEITSQNDIELFDLLDDPNEMKNLASTETGLLEDMNDKMNRLIELEVGEDDGSFLEIPQGAVIIDKFEL